MWMDYDIQWMKLKYWLKTGTHGKDKTPSSSIYIYKTFIRQVTANDKTGDRIYRENSNMQKNKHHKTLTFSLNYNWHELYHGITEISNSIKKPRSSVLQHMTEWNLYCKVINQFNIRTSDMENMQNSTKPSMFNTAQLCDSSRHSTKDNK